jgi:Ca2+-binding RTX toxin-like protein
VLQPADRGWTIRSQVTATNGGGFDVGVSNHTFPILPKTRFGPANTDPPTLAGKPVVGSTLVATAGTWTGEPPIKYTYTWLHCDATGQDCTAIPNVARTTYKLKVSDAGYTIKLLVTGRNALAAGTVNSDPSDVIVQLPPQPKGRKITGTKKNDYLAGGGGPDTIKGLGGNDTIMGGGGDDTLNGGDGNDVIDGGAGADKIQGGKGSDTILSADGQRDTVDCGPGVDKATVDAIDIVKNCESISTPLSSGNLPRRGR